MSNQVYESLLLAAGVKAGDGSGWSALVEQVPSSHLAGLRFVPSGAGDEALYHPGQKSIVFDPDGSVNGVVRAIGQHLYATAVGASTKALTDEAFAGFSGDLGDEEVYEPADLFGGVYELAVYTKATGDALQWDTLANGMPKLAALVARNVGMDWQPEVTVAAKAHWDEGAASEEPAGDGDVTDAGEDVVEDEEPLSEKALTAFGEGFTSQRTSAIVDLPDAILDAFLSGVKAGKSWEANLQDGDFLVIEKKDGETIRHLAITKTSGGKPKRSVCAAAWAALTSNHRGQPYQGPDKAGALTKLKDIYAAQGWPLPGSEDQGQGTVDTAAKAFADALVALPDDALEAFTKACKPKGPKRPKPKGVEVSDPKVVEAEALQTFLAGKSYGPPHLGLPGHRGGSAPRGGVTNVGITSARPDKTAEGAVYKDMQAFEQQLRGIRSVNSVRVEPGRGAWDTGSEPTWIVQYRGNGEAKKLLAATGKKYNQDSVLMYEPAKRGDKDTAPLFDLDFGQDLDEKEVKSVEEALLTHKTADGNYVIGGWTWFGKEGSKHKLRMVYIPDWAACDPATFTATVRKVAREAKSVFGQAGLHGDVAKVSMMSRDGSPSYDDVLNGN